MNTQFYKELQIHAERIVDEAVSILVQHEHNFTIATQKDEIDVATSADLEVEQHIKTEVKKIYPDHGFLGEEFGSENGENDYIWIIDPLDNTKEYVKGIGEYNCLLALEEKGELVVGITRRVGHDVRYACSKGNGASKDGEQIHVSKKTDLQTAFIGSNLPNRKTHTASNIHQYMLLNEALIKSVYRLRISFDDARMLGWVAQGAIEGFLSLPNTNKWVDVAPGILLVTEAGGKVTNWKGESITNHDLSNGLVASNGLLHDQLLTIIQKEIYDKS